MYKFFAGERPSCFHQIPLGGSWGEENFLGYVCAASVFVSDALAWACCTRTSALRVRVRVRVRLNPPCLSFLYFFFFYNFLSGLVEGLSMVTLAKAKRKRGRGGAVQGREPLLHKEKRKEQTLARGTARAGGRGKGRGDGRGGGGWPRSPGGHSSSLFSPLGPEEPHTGTKGGELTNTAQAA